TLVGDGRYAMKWDDRARSCESKIRGRRGGEPRRAVSIGDGTRRRDRAGAGEAALPARNRTAVRAGRGMPEKGADRVGHRVRKDVLEDAGLLLDLRVLHAERLREERFGEPLAADQVLAAPAPRLRERRLRAGAQDPA